VRRGNKRSAFGGAARALWARFAATPCRWGTRWGLRVRTRRCIVSIAVISGAKGVRLQRALPITLWRCAGFAREGRTEEALREGRLGALGRVVLRELKHNGKDASLPLGACCRAQRGGKRESGLLEVAGASEGASRRRDARRAAPCTRAGMRRPLAREASAGGGSRARVLCRVRAAGRARALLAGDLAVPVQQVHAAVRALPRLGHEAKRVVLQSPRRATASTRVRREATLSANLRIKARSATRDAHAERRSAAAQRHRRAQRRSRRRERGALLRALRHDFRSSARRPRAMPCMGHRARGLPEATGPERSARQVILYRIDTAERSLQGA
jgi:hypothetical protein